MTFDGCFVLFHFALLVQCRHLAFKVNKHARPAKSIVSAVLPGSAVVLKVRLIAGYSAAPSSLVFFPNLAYCAFSASRYRFLDFGGVVDFDKVRKEAPAKNSHIRTLLERFAIRVKMYVLRIRTSSQSSRDIIARMRSCKF